MIPDGFYLVRWPAHAGLTHEVLTEDEDGAWALYLRVEESARLGLCRWAELHDSRGLLAWEVYSGRPVRLGVRPRGRELEPARRLVEVAYAEVG